MRSHVITRTVTERVVEANAADVARALSSFVSRSVPAASEIAVEIDGQVFSLEGGIKFSWIESERTSEH